METLKQAEMAADKEKLTDYIISLGKCLATQPTTTEGTDMLNRWYLEIENLLYTWEGDVKSL
jgi:hypothetical protein